MTEKTMPAATEEKQSLSKQEETRQEERYLIPPVDIYEKAEGLVVIVDMPGVNKEGIDVRVDDNILTIKGKTNHIAPGDAVSTEFRLLNFYRQFQLGDRVDQEKITADLKRGVLTIQLPKFEEHKPKKITINVN